jgi:glutamine amidotransferase-like uncharacterized protein
MTDEVDITRIAEVVDSLHGVVESKQVSADVAIISLISTAGEIALSIIVAHPELKEAYIKIFNSATEQVRKQLKMELKSRQL